MESILRIAVLAMAVARVSGGVRVSLAGRTFFYTEEVVSC